MGHSVYSFVRNKSHYYDIAKIINNNTNNNNNDNVYVNSYLFKVINRIIVQKNLSQFYALLFDLTENNKNIVFNSNEKIFKFLNENNWKKGKKLFEFFYNSK